jgi:hypothetical protein
MPLLLDAPNLGERGDFCAVLLDWILANPERTLDLFPEWKAMLEAVRA